MSSQAYLRELGEELVDDGQWERALAVFAEAVRRRPDDHQSRVAAARCYEGIKQPERAVTVYHACAEGLLRRDFLLSAISAAKAALALAPDEVRVHDTLARIHARASAAAPGRAKVPPPLPPEAIFDGNVQADLMGLTGSVLWDRAIEVLGAPESGATAPTEARPPLPLFAELPLAAFVDLIRRMDFRTLPPNEVVVREGQVPDAIYVIVAGKVEAKRERSPTAVLASMSGGSIFGELAMMTGTPLSVTISTLVRTDVLEFRREHLNQLARSFPEVPDILVRFAQDRMAKTLMATAPLFQPIPEAARRELLRRFDFRAIQAGEAVMVEGQGGQGLYIVLAGELVAEKTNPTGGMISLGVLREGDVAGEMSLLTGDAATATVRATRKTAVGFLTRPSFVELLESYPSVKDYLQDLAHQRSLRMGEALRPLEIIDADELVLSGEIEV